MLGVVPFRRKNALTVLASGAWNLLVLSPFVIAFWILTEVNQARSYDNCGGIVWDVANFARWAFLGFTIYTLCAIPLNICNIGREQKAQGAKTHEWLRMFDTLHWLANWALFFYLITALSSRDQCNDHKITSLLWCIVFISVFFGVCWAIYTIVALTIFAIRAIDDVLHETKAAQALELRGGVEILDIKRTGMQNRDNLVMTGNRMRTTDPIREAEMKRGDLEANRGVLDKREERVYEREMGTKSEVPLGDPRRERFEPVNIRDEPVRENLRVREEQSIERADYDDTRPVENRVIRNLDTHGSQFNSKY